jgi:hypothetical protein
MSRPPTISNSFKSRQIEITEKLTVTGNISSTGSMIVDTSSSTDAALRVTQRGEGNVIEIEDKNRPDYSPLVVTKNGTVVIGFSSVPFFSEELQGVQLVSEIPESSSGSENRNNLQLVRASAGGEPQPNIRFLRTRGTLTNPLTVEPNDGLGGLYFMSWMPFPGSTGSSQRWSSGIQGLVDTTTQPITSIIPGALRFFTTSLNYAGSGTGLTERMRIDSEGRVGIGTATPNERLTVAGNISATGDINTSGRILSGSVDLFDLFTSSELASGIQTLSYVPSSYELSISLGNTVSLSSLNTTFTENSAKLELTYTTVSSNSSLWTAGYAIASALSANSLDTALKYLSTSNVAISSIVSETITVSTLNVPVTVITVSGTRVFTDTDSNKAIHFNTTSTSVCAVFPLSLTNGFNVAIMNTGINSVVLSSNIPLKATGTTIIDQYGGAFIYKQNDDIFAVGRLY